MGGGGPLGSRGLTFGARPERATASNFARAGAGVAAFLDVGGSAPLQRASHNPSSRLARAWLVGGELQLGLASTRDLAHVVSARGRGRAANRRAGAAGFAAAGRLDSITGSAARDQGGGSRYPEHARAVQLGSCSAPPRARHQACAELLPSASHATP